MEDLTWRSATADDEPLLQALFAANKAPEFAPLGLSPQQLAPLLDMQYRARALSYAQQFPTAVNMILTLADGTPIGRHLVERQSDCYRGIDLGVLPAFQNRGIGTWALRQAQTIAALEEVPFRLSVRCLNPAQRLYESLGFLRIDADAVSFEMEWLPPSVLAARPRPQPLIAVPDGTTFDREDILRRIFAFLAGIGLTVTHGTVPSVGFLPGVQLIANGLRIDLDALLYPGDLLHEAGHLAVISPERRSAEFPAVNEPAEEMAALAWSYAAAVHIGIPAEIVFHDAGYRGQARQLAHGYRHGTAVGLPMLWYLGLTTRPEPGTPSIYPRMTRWLRDAAPCDEGPGTQQGPQNHVSTRESGPKDHAKYAANELGAGAFIKEPSHV